MLRERTGADEGPGGAALPDAVAGGLPATLRTDEGYRSVLVALLEHGETCSVATLTRTLVDGAGWPLTAGVTDPYQQTHIALVREYVPVLVEFGVVEYDREMGTVKLIADGS